MPGKYRKVEEYVQYEECPDCRKRKPGRKTDCAIFNAVFERREPNALNNIDKFFSSEGCKYFDMRKTE